MLCILFEGGAGGSEKVYVLYTHLNVDIIGTSMYAADRISTIRQLSMIA